MGASRIWTRAPGSICFDDYRYAWGTNREEENVKKRMDDLSTETNV